MHHHLELGAAFWGEERLRQLIGAYLDYQRSLITRKAYLRHYPPALMIEPTNICNLHCPLCPSGNATLTRPRGMMPLSLFQHVLDQVYSKIGMLILWNQGESFLNPEFISMIRYAATKGLYTMASTNASLPLDLEAIINSGLNKLIFSLDGITPESYNKYRVGGDFELVMSNLQALVDLKKSMGAAKPYIVWQFIVMRHNEHEIPRLKTLAKQLRVDKLELKTAQIYTAEDLHYLPAKHRYSRYRKEGDSFELKTRLLNRCRRLWTQPVVAWNGELCICCYDKDLKYQIGNLYQESFEALWFGKKMQRLRQQVLENRASIPICRNCGEGIVQKIR